MNAIAAGERYVVRRAMMFAVLFMVPFAVLLSPAVIFFFNMAAETHVFMHKSKP